MAQTFDFVYNFIKFAVSIAMKIFFQDLTSFNSSRVPSKGATVFVIGPHNNYFVDAMLMLVTCPRKTGFVVAQPTMKRRFVGAIARMIGSISVTRPQDLREKVDGTIIFEEESNRILGFATKFKSQFKIGDSIYAVNWKRSAVIDSIESDTVIFLKEKGFQVTEYPPQPGESPFLRPHSLSEDDDVTFEHMKEHGNYPAATAASQANRKDHFNLSIFKKTSPDHNLSSSSSNGSIAVASLSPSVHENQRKAATLFPASQAAAAAASATAMSPYDSSEKGSGGNGNKQALKSPAELQQNEVDGAAPASASAPPGATKEATEDEQTEHQRHPDRESLLSKTITGKDSADNANIRGVKSAAEGANNSINDEDANANANAENALLFKPESDPTQQQYGQRANAPASNKNDANESNHNNNNKSWFLNLFSSASSGSSGASSSPMEATTNGRFRRKVRPENIIDFKEPTTMKRTPKIDQSEVYQKVWNELYAGSCVSVFPEGASHDRTEMLPLKAGVTMMVLGAMSQRPGLEVQIVPVGLNYFQAHRFRSRAYVDYGTGIQVPPELVKWYTEGGPKKREACSRLLEMIHDGINRVTISAPDPDSLRLFKATAALYVSPKSAVSPEHQLELTRRFARLYLKHRDNVDVMNDIKRTATRILEYDRLLTQHGLEDKDVRTIRQGGLWTFVLFLYRLISLILMAALSIPGVILASPVAAIADAFSRKKGREAMEDCDANIYGAEVPGADVLASWKVIIAFALLPFTMTIYTFVVALIVCFVWNPASVALQAVIPVAFFILFPFVVYASIRFTEIGGFLIKSLKPLLYSLLRLSKGNDLLTLRKQIKQELSVLLDKLGRDSLKSFDNIRSRSMENV